jgi:hypothetical protein
MGFSADVTSRSRFVRDGLLSVAPYVGLCALVILVHLGVKLPPGLDVLSLMSLGYD